MEGIKNSGYIGTLIRVYKVREVHSSMIEHEIEGFTGIGVLGLTP